MLVSLDVQTQAGSELRDITAQLQQAVRSSGAQEGVCHLFVPHTTAGLTLNENWDPDVRGDLVRALADLVPDVPAGSYEVSYINTLSGEVHSETRALGKGESLQVPFSGERFALLIRKSNS